MARVRVAVPDESSNEFISAKAAHMIGQERPTQTPPKNKNLDLPKLPGSKLLYLTGIVVALLVVFLFVTVLQDRKKLQEKVDQLSTQASPQTSQDDEVTALQSEISKFLELPVDETPTLATVSDIDKVKSQAFFKNAQNGDKVLLYAKAGKAILYRPSTNKVIEVALINSAKPTTQP